VVTPARGPVEHTPHQISRCRTARVCGRDRQGACSALARRLLREVLRGSRPRHRLRDNCVGWDLEHGDAQLLDRIEDESFDFVYSSHTLEHVADASAALRNWYRVVKPGGHLILFVPDRDLYEKKLTLPSRWNPDHKRFFLLDRDQPPATAGLLQLIDKVIPDATAVRARRCAEGHSIDDPLMHSDGEYSIEVIVRKPLS